MKVIFAQGNRGDRYKGTRHNVGFWIIDHLAHTWSGSFVDKPKFHAAIAETTQNGEKILLVKPTTFYNETGLAARALVDFYKLNPATDLLVIHDELALPIGVVRTRLSGSPAGNNGIKSLNTHIGPDYGRLRVGIYAPLRDQMDDAEFVLGKFSKEEQETIASLTPHITQLIDGFITGPLTVTKVTFPLPIDKNA